MFTGILQSLFSVLLAVLSFFTNTFGLIGNRSEPPRDGLVRVSYGDGACEEFDICFPKNAKGEVDVVLMIHGGAWALGNQSEFSEYCITAAEDYGYVGVTMDYGKVQNGVFVPDMVDEIYATIVKIKALAAEKGLTADKIAVCGHSAGANIALLYCYTHYDDSPIDLAFAVSASAPSYFFDPNADGSTTMEKFGYAVPSLLTGKVVTSFNAAKMADVIKTVNPIDNVCADVPPTLAIHGAQDTMVPYSNSVNLCKRLTENGVYNRLITYPGSDHFLREDAESMMPVRAAAFEDFAELYF